MYLSFGSHAAALDKECVSTFLNVFVFASGVVQVLSLGTNT